LTEQFSESKRSFLKQLVLWLTLALAGVCSWGAARFALFGSREETVREFPREMLETLQPEEPVHLSSAGAWLVKTRADDRVVALDDRCPHLGCRQKWIAERKLFECPCHGSVFDLEGNVTRGPAARALPRLQLHMEGDTKIRLLESRPNP